MEPPTVPWLDLPVHVADDLSSWLPPGEVVSSDSEYHRSPAHSLTARGLALNPSPLVDGALTINDVDSSWLEAPPTCREDPVEKVTDFDPLWFTVVLDLFQLFLAWFWLKCYCKYLIHYSAYWLHLCIAACARWNEFMFHIYTAPHNVCRVLSIIS